MPRATRPAATGITAAVIYTRVSSEEQEREGQSLAAQLTQRIQLLAQTRMAGLLRGQSVDDLPGFNEVWLSD